MRLHSLEITAFGAFAGTEKVDFDELGADGLFLLHGQTGAGKTTVLDAVAYALYGTVPGSRQSGKRLHSDHADRDTCPKVVLEATIGGRHLRLARSPEFMRPKKRGEGFTPQPASGTLEWLDGNGENLSRLNDIGAEVLRLLGMSAEQFFQVVLLPQGEFAKFLKAETRERASLLEKLFDTSRFNSVEDWFKERRRVSEAGVAGQRQVIGLELAGLATAAETENFEPTEECPSSLVWAQSLVATSSAQSVESETALASARRTAEATASELARVQGQARAQKRGSEASAQLAAYLEGAAERRLMTVEADLAARAEKVEWANTVLAASQRDRDAVLGRAADLERTLGDDPTVAPVLAAGRADGAELDRRTLASSVREWDAELTRLEQSRDIEEALARDQASLATRRARLGELATQAQTSAARLEALPAAVALVAERLASAQAARQALPGLTTTRDAAATAAGAAEQLVRAQARQTQCETALSAAKAAHNDARDIALDLRERRLNGMAAELAGQLVDGDACTVCGSTAHPAPAVATEDVVTKDAEEAAQQVVAAALTTLQDANAQLSEAQQAVTVHLVASGGLAPAAAKEALDQATAELAATSASAAALESHEAELADLNGQRELLEVALADTEKSTALTEHEAAQLEQQVAAAEIKLTAIIGADGSVAGRMARITAARDHIERLAELLGQVESAVTAVEKDQAQVDEAVEAADFENLTAALSAVRTAERRTQISRALSTAAEQSASARAVLEEPDVLAVAGLDPAPVEESAASAAAASAELEAALRTHEQAQRRRAAVEAKFAGLKAAVEKLEPIEKRHESLAALAEVMLGDGQNSRRMSLGTYVLAARLEEVAVVASRRLRAMSGGRFEFIHSDGKVKRELRGGLALNILDANTGSVRPTSTLSGGETFMASLALALGLADVVAEEAGGIQLETLFIDEGFGTLDSEALDLVMGVLDELRAGGRSVGIVSHVAEMQHRIPSRLFVKKGESGSTLHMSER